MADSLIQPFRRTLTVDPVIIPVGVNPTPTKIPDMTGQGVTAFILHNPTPCWAWFAGWRGTMADMPVIKEKGQYLAPGASFGGRTQMPQWIAGQLDDEPLFPLYDANGSYLYANKRMRLVIIYGSGF